MALFKFEGAPNLEERRQKQKTLKQNDERARRDRNGQGFALREGKGEETGLNDTDQQPEEVPPTNIKTGHENAGMKSEGGG